MTEELRNPEPDDVTLVTMAFAKSTTLMESIKFKLRKLDWVEDRTDKALHLVVNLNDKMIEFKISVDRQFDCVRQRMDTFQEDVQKRFAAVDKRFDTTDKRLAAVDRRLDGDDQRLDAFEANVNQRFEAVDKRFDEMSRDMNERFGTIEMLLRELAGRPA